MKLADYHILCVCGIELEEQQTEHGIELFCPECDIALCLIKPVEYEVDEGTDLKDALDKAMTTDFHELVKLLQIDPSPAISAPSIRQCNCDLWGITCPKCKP